MKENTCYIVGAGEFFGSLPTLCKGDYLIAADGGYSHLSDRGVSPDLVVGDLDSLGHPPEGVPCVILPSVKDDTDMAYAINTGRQLGYRRFVIYGGTGGRIDHTLANIQCLAGLSQNGCRGFIVDKENIITALSDGCASFPAISSGFISVFSHGERAVGVTETGLKYSLLEAELSSCVPLGVSNEFIGCPSRISVEKGTLILVYPKYVKEI